jgi:cell division protein FtsL
MSAVALLQPRTVRETPRAATHAEPSVRSETSGGRRHLLLVLAAAAVLVSSVFGIVGLGAMAADASVRARALEQEVAQAERRHGELIVAVASKEDPARIRARALELGLVPSTAARHLVLDRVIDADGARSVAAEDALVTDPLKSVLTQER